MNSLKYIYTIALFFILLCSNDSLAQKTVYAPGNENWPEKIEEETGTKMFSVFLVGDLKYPKNNRNLDLLQKELFKEGKKSALVILGDIVYPSGLPDDEDPEYANAKEKHDAILKRLEDYKGEIVFLPGNHDWAKGGEEGWESVEKQENYIEDFLDRGNTYIPNEGCPGPVEVELTDDITLIVINSQWWFHKFEKQELDDCDIEDENDLYIQIEDAIRRNSDKKILIATHHPLFSVGIHGGHFPFLANIFPLTKMNQSLYIPLPGFIYTGYRKFFGNIQDLSHPDYKDFKTNLLGIFENYPNLIYAAGHEHNLQYVEKNGLHHVISGGGGVGTFIAGKKKKTDFAAQSKGFARLDFYENGNVWLQFVAPEKEIEKKVLFNKKLFNKPVFHPEIIKQKFENISFQDSMVKTMLNDKYMKGKFHRFLMGDNYRKIWNTQVNFPVFDIGNEKGGLTIIKRGGGQQTRSVRLEDKNGKQYVLRSANKFVEKALDETMRNTIAQDVVQDAISASHPYAAVTVPKMANAAGVMHTNPKLVWVPDDPRLGIYRNDIANGVFLFEERPAKNRDDVASFGRSEDIVNTAETVKRTNDEHDHIVDQQAVLKARLFDVLINDWDRHDDQWRWATFDENDTKIYRPVPRDRDQVYFVNQGVIMWIATRKWAQPKFQGFDSNIKNVTGLGFNSRYFDRAFLSEPDLDDWLTTAKELKQSITDSVIHEAIKEMPPEIYELSGKEIESKLKGRKEFLPKYAEELYKFLAKEVDVVGTDERDLFKVNRYENGNTKVEVFALSDKKGNVQEKLYERTFLPSETKEIRLYGLKENDEFVLNGKAKKGIKIRIIPGKNNDKITDNSSVKGWSKKTLVYERKNKKNDFETGRETKIFLRAKKSMDNYNREQYKFDKTMPLIAGGYNIDDGIFVGAGVNFKNYNFRDSSFHQLTGKMAFQTGAFGIAYKGLVSSVSQDFDLEIDANVSVPRSEDNFFGLGNETEKISDSKRFYRVRYQYVWVNPTLKFRFRKAATLSLGAFYQYYHVTDTAGRYIGQLHNEMLSSSAFEKHNYAGVNTNFTVDTRDNKTFPKRGIYWNSEANGYYSIKEKGKNVIKLQSELGFYLSFRKDPRFVLAARFGGAANIGDYNFFHANFLGRKSNLRGYRDNRFAGDHLFYQNTELRIKLANFRSYLLNGQAGLLLFNDIGRVWLKNENSDKWHNGYGGGFWIAPFDTTAITLTYGRSEEDSLIDFAFSYMF